MQGFHEWDLSHPIDMQDTAPIPKLFDSLEMPAKQDAKTTLRKPATQRRMVTYFNLPDSVLLPASLTESLILPPHQVQRYFSLRSPDALVQYFITLYRTATFPEVGRPSGLYIHRGLSSLNSVLQCLFHFPPFILHYLSKQLEGTSTTTNSPKDPPPDKTGHRKTRSPPDTSAPSAPPPPHRTHLLNRLLSLLLQLYWFYGSHPAPGFAILPLMNALLKSPFDDILPRNPYDFLLYLINVLVCPPIIFSLIVFFSTGSTLYRLTVSLSQRERMRRLSSWRTRLSHFPSFALSFPLCLSSLSDWILALQVQILIFCCIIRHTLIHSNRYITSSVNISLNPIRSFFIHLSAYVGLKLQPFTRNPYHLTSPKTMQ